MKWINCWSYIMYFSNTWEKMEYCRAMPQLFIEFKKAYDWISREVFYNNFNELGILMKLVKLLKMCLYETCTTIQVGKCLTHFLLTMVCSKEMLYRHCFATLLYNMPLGRFKQNRRDWNWMVHISFWFMLMLIYWWKHTYYEEKHRSFRSH
jgi:hypothetical protein